MEKEISMQVINSHENLHLEKIKASVIYNMKVKMKRLNLSTNDLI